jgi:hypothetical protein
MVSMKSNSPSAVTMQSFTMGVWCLIISNQVIVDAGFLMGIASGPCAQFSTVDEDHTPDHFIAT